MVSQSLVIQPDVPFSSIQNAFSGPEWQSQYVSKDCLIPGEPENASWFRVDSCATASYTFNPVFYLRVVSIVGTAGETVQAAVRAMLPVLDRSGIEALLNQGESRKLVLGILAAAEVREQTLLPRIVELLLHEEAHVRSAAETAIARFGENLWSAGVERLAAGGTESARTAALFDALSPVLEATQLVRWIAKDKSSLNSHILDTLRAALASDDWEVRVSAMLAAARLDAKELSKEIRKVLMPRSTSDGLGRKERELANASKKAAIALLAGDIPTKTIDPKVPPAGRDQTWSHICYGILGDLTFLDGVTLFLKSMLDPLDLPQRDESSATPDGVEARDHRFFLAGTDIELVWIAAVTHFLGESDDFPGRGTIRELSPRHAFFISKSFLDSDCAEPIGMTLRDIDRTSGAWLESWPGAMAVVDEFADLIGGAVELPTADQWEMAARGPDGRRFPWGNNARNVRQNRASPWGLEQAVGVVPQWTSTREGEDPIVCGGPKQWMCAERAPMDPAQGRAAMRLVIEDL